ncbi:MAG: cytochrome d ubiquinol oxidase subunit II [Desulfobulbaceae bacterium]|nr:cytochrome d ubiquinol oxidase subunit II [Desulfobulbaceae bacterium]
MEFFNNNLAELWLLLIAFFLLFYALTDGADLGIGMLTLITRDLKERQAMMGTIETIWHGNQTWLVILGGMLFGAFPLFYSIVLSALYIPFTLMLFGLIFRGVAFEFHANSPRKSLWMFSFGIGSLLTTLGQGFALGGLLCGITVENSEFAGHPLDWVNWYSVVAAAGVLCVYLMLGSSFLIARTTGVLRERSHRAAAYAGIFTFLISGAIISFTTGLYEEIAAKWAAWPRSPLPLFILFAMAGFFMFFRSLRLKKQLAPLVWSRLIILFTFTELSIGFYPNMIPSVATTSLTVQDVAASPVTLKFMLATTAILLPVILVYTSYSYWIFRGKKSTGHGTGNKY